MNKRGMLFCVIAKPLCVLLLTLLSLVGSRVSAQSTFATVLGTVRDARGAAIANAAVKLTNVDENTVRDTTSNEQGDYEFLNLKPGRYKVTATVTGFRLFQTEEQVLVARQVLRVDPTLEVGSLEQVVTVEGQAGVIATDK